MCFFMCLFSHLILPGKSLFWNASYSTFAPHHMHHNVEICRDLGGKSPCNLDLTGVWNLFLNVFLFLLYQQKSDLIFCAVVRKTFQVLKSNLCLTL
jgi:hypothetical protein